MDHFPLFAALQGQPCLLVGSSEESAALAGAGLSVEIVPDMLIVGDVVALAGTLHGREEDAEKTALSTAA